MAIADASLLGRLAPRFFDWFKTSENIAAMHQKHIESETVVHMMKGTPFATAPDTAKLDFARSTVGAAVVSFMQLEQQYIGDWKVQRIVEAAGADFDAAGARLALSDHIASAPVVIFSFVDCPWCLLAKEALLDELSLAQGETSGDLLRVIELEDLGRMGKSLRAAIALATGRTSMPAIFVGGRAIGGYTDGEPVGDTELCWSDSPGLERLVEQGALKEMLQQAGVKFDQHLRL